MSVELEEVRNFLATTAPFAQLPDAVIDQLPAKMDMRYVRSGTTIIQRGAHNDFCFIIRSGAVDVIGDNDILLDRRDAGRCFGYSTIFGENNSRYTMIAVEDCLLMAIKREHINTLAEQYPDLARFFSSLTKRISAAAAQLRAQASSDLLRIRLSEFMVKNPVHATADISIVQAAQIMQEHNVSSLLIVEQAQTQSNDTHACEQSVIGIITDKDLRNKVVAKNMDTTQNVHRIMAPMPRTLNDDVQAFEAMMLMSEYGIQHIPVTRDNELVGIVSSADILRLMRNDPIYLTADLSRKNSIDELKDTYSSIDEVAVRFIDRGTSPEDIAGLLTMTADTLTRRLLYLAEQKLGHPPVPYEFVVVGSQGRKGMGLASDQDNCLVLDDNYNPQQHGHYFEQLSRFVCEGLAQAGQPLCPGEMMAMNPQWRMTRTQWIDTFHHWITAPEPEALLHVQTFFDFRSIYTSTTTQLAQEVHKNAVEMAQSSVRLQAHLATLAVRREPPLGFFRGFVVDRSGKYANTLDVKKGGLAAIVQMARLFSLTSGITALTTRQRLVQAAQAGSISERGSQDLIDAVDFINLISLKHQSEQIKQGQTPSYHIAPATLGKMDREHLRDSFQIIKNMQNALATKYPIRNI
ncbi:DUF294 nucleotidyltransferase-like domain-containing protein [Corynebacterium sp. sy039]|uniref:DUF294 nucleotidyltransferase-like domain-containing protein n=1 Tax=Corynebacterium sp. sy039 TaxID=2599641 RepID=UPI0011B4B5EF|nr:DUF294 nucleotidyltransferase-like domain-containing protein [Corynebacterium sp. sy039]QDZ42427.1 cyclic nucleotide-binding/CBS domain-containing protein [Corynebacterium sp. sy039]